MNVAALIELPSGKRPRPLVWTDERARVFLARARRHRLYALFHLIALRGLRRGEACGLRRYDTDLGTATATIRWQITQLGWEMQQGAPKSEADERHVALDAHTVTVIRAHRAREDRARPGAPAGQGPQFEFTGEDGAPLHPASVTALFEMLAYLAGLPPIRLHDLRHGAATLLLAAGHHMKVVQETLGLSSITIAADTYTSVLPELARRSAEDVAALTRTEDPASHQLGGPSRATTGHGDRPPAAAATP